MTPCGALAFPSEICIQTSDAYAQFPSHEYFTARLELDRPAGEEMTSAFEERRARTYARLEQQLAEEPDVVAVTFADRVPGVSFAINRTASVDIPSGAGPAFQTGFATSSVGPGFFEAFDRRSSPDAASMAATSVPLPER